MRCPSCGAFYKDVLEVCAECGPLAINEMSMADSISISSPHSSDQSGEVMDPAGSSGQPKQSSVLIEFPGASRSSVPQWRKELSERVREVQERRAREAALEAANDALHDKPEDVTSIPQLELLPQAELPPVNPLVAAALRRIERAHGESQLSSHRRHQPMAAAAVACALENEFSSNNIQIDDTQNTTDSPNCGSVEPATASLEDIPPPIEKSHNLVVVSAPVVPPPLEIKLKPKRLIGDDVNDPALNYLDAVPTTIHVEDISKHRAPAFRRMLSALLDLITVVFLSSPYAAIVELRNAHWQNWRVIAFAGATFVVVSFLYLTICIAFTGRTLGMRLLSLRVIDARTGLIPTGGQSAGRALIYILSLLSAGMALILAFLDSDRRAFHDRFTRTAVIRL
jgi:uncharacterized RDD family membrane protein YckC